jgi:DeoR/GlpR family transcriptional regulator of sugar metabolism
MKAKPRRAEIKAILRERPASVDELAELYGVSPSTIRRDLGVLSVQGDAVRTYGGALAAAPGEQSLHEREHLALAQKAAIALAAARRVRDGQFLLLDAGTTVGALAKVVSQGHRLTVATNGLTSIEMLADSAEVELIVLGGALRHISQGMIGPMAESALATLSADIAFLGADGVSAERGVCEGTAEQSSLKRLMVERSGEVIVLADSSKLGSAGSHWWTPLDRAWTLITDDGATGEQLEPFRRRPQISIEVARTPRKVKAAKKATR